MGGRLTLGASLRSKQNRRAAPNPQLIDGKLFILNYTFRTGTELIYRPPKTNRYFVTPYGWKVARLFSRLDGRVFRPAMAMFTANDAVLAFPLKRALVRVDAQLDALIYEAFPLPKTG